MLFRSIVSAVLFAVVHPYTHWPQIFLLGLLLTYLYERTRSLWPSIALHAMNNAVAMTSMILLMR